MKRKTLFLLFVSFLSFSVFAQVSTKPVSENETTIRSYLDAGQPEPIEGIYKSMSGAYYRIGIKKVAENKYVAYVLDMDPRLKKRWKQGDIKATLEKSTLPYLYSIRWIWNNKTAQETVAKFENNSILRMDDGPEALKYLKIYPVAAVN
jgi:hypothetical protein